jgi:hypothetical protein
VSSTKNDLSVSKKRSKWDHGSWRSLRLRYFDEILPVEKRAINARRQAVRKGLDIDAFGPVRPINTKSSDRSLRIPSQPPPQLSGRGPVGPNDVRLGGTAPPDPDRARPRPIPCDATGLALSGGGIRSAAFCLGALQALNSHRVIESIDYLSTVSGGSYVGACMTAAMSKTKGKFPFGDKGSVQDSPAVGHLRNYSNYLLPRAHTTVQNISEATVIILRGLVANAAFVLTILLALALLTRLAHV